MRVYQVTNPIAFKATPLPYPTPGLIFWSQGKAGGVLLLPGVHYQLTGGAGSAQFFILSSAVNLQAGDMIAVIG